MNKLFAYFLLLLTISVKGQESVLTFDQVIEKALKNNYNLRITKNQAEKVLNNNTLGNAGFTPTVDANFGYNKSTNSINQEFANGLEINRNNVGSTNTSADVSMNWTIFNGFRMFATKNRLENLSLQAQSQLKIQIENTIVEVTTLYFDLVRQTQLLKAMRESIALSNERVIISERKMNNGSGSRLEYLQANTELNRQKAEEINLIAASDESRINLNRAIAEKAETNFIVNDSIVVSYRPTFEDLNKKITEKNNLLQFYRLNERIAAAALKENKSFRYPIVNLNGRYSYSKSTSEAGFSLFNQNNGFVYGFTATLPLFNGWNIDRQIKNSRLDLLNAQLSLESATNDINAELANAWRNFNNSLQLLKLEEDNIKFAREVLYVAQERFRIGISSNLELQEAQRTFEDAMNRLANARYNVKVNEVNLQRLNGELIK